MKLEDYIDPLAYDIAFWMQGLSDPEYPRDELGKLSLEISDKLRTVGIIIMLVHAEPDGLFHNLIRSGRARTIYFERLRDAGVTDDVHQVSGRLAPLLDAIAAGDFDLARLIVNLSPPNFRPRDEYEDDFCYAQILGQLLLPSSPSTRLLSLLTQFERYLAGEDSPRLNVCRAIADADQAAFDESIESILDAHELQVAAEKDRGKIESPAVIVRRHVSIEGLAILRLAEFHGLRTSPGYRFCPSLARGAMSRPFPGE